VISDSNKCLMRSRNESEASASHVVARRIGVGWYVVSRDAKIKAPTLPSSLR
jgi:hypothetical protein